MLKRRAHQELDGLVEAVKRVRLEDDPSDEALHVQRLKAQNRALRRSVRSLYRSLKEERGVAEELRRRLSESERWARRLERLLPPDADLGSEPAARDVQSFG